MLSFSGTWCQQVYQTVSYLDEEIRAASFTPQDYGHKILNSLAITSVKGLKWVYVDFRGRLLIQTEASEDGHILAYTRLIDYTLAGDHYFRDFNIDSLLVPKAISGNLSFISDRDTLYTVPIEMLLTGGVTDLGRVGITLDSLSKLKARIDVDRFIYTEEQYTAFLSTTRLINYYHAYSEVLALLIDEYDRSGIGRRQPSAFVFTASHEISRVVKYARSYDFETRLQLRDADPSAFLKKFDRAKRLERRAATIFTQVLQTQAKGAIEEKNNYCLDYAGISRKYNQLSKSYQPYIAAGFIELMRIFPDSLEIQKIREAEKFYDVFNKLDLASTPQCIYDQFLELAREALQEDQYVQALDYIYNASFIDKQFDQVVAAEAHQQIYLKTLDKLMSAYLQIAIVAYRSGNFLMADNYYQKANEIYTLHLANLQADTISLAVFLDFINQQVELAYRFLGDERFYEGLRMVDRANNIARRNDIEEDDQLIDSAYMLAYSGIYRQKLDSVGMLIDGRHHSSARGALEHTFLFTDGKAQYIDDRQDPRLSAFARTLFDYYVAEGVRQLRGAHPGQALYSFLEAQSINESYIRAAQPRLDSLIYQSTVPVILDVIRRGEFDLWANRLEQARVKYEEANALMVKYRQQDNEEVIRALNSFDKKLNNQFCARLDNSLFELRQKVSNRLRNRKYNEALELLEEAQLLLTDAPACELDTGWITEAEASYAPAFEHLVNERTIRELVSLGNYGKAVEAYLDMESYALQEELSSFGITVPSLAEYITRQDDPALALAAARHFLKLGEGTQAIACLEVIRKHDVPAKSVKDEQTEAGRILAAADNGSVQDKKETVGKYTRGSKWYKYLRSAYLAE